MSLKSSIKYSENEITEILLKNTLTMVEERGLLKKKDHAKNLKNLLNQIKDDMLFSLIDGKEKIGIRIANSKFSQLKSGFILLTWSRGSTVFTRVPITVGSTMKN